MLHNKLLLVVIGCLLFSFNVSASELDHTEEYFPQEASTEVPDIMTREEFRSELQSIMEEQETTEEIEPIEIFKPEKVEDNSSSNVRKVIIWQFYLTLIFFGFEVVTWFDSKMEKIFKRMGKE